MSRSKTVDMNKAIMAAIEKLFPDHTKPDEENYLTTGDQYKAPDYEIVEERLLIELKSLNMKDNSQFYRKLTGIADRQGSPFVGYGRFGLHRVIEKLPDPIAATQELLDFRLSQMMKKIREADRKFRAHAQHTNSHQNSKLVILADNSELHESTAPIEKFLGRRMGGYDRSKDDTGTIDAIVYAKVPERVLQAPNSYWFKCLVKHTVDRERTEIVVSFAAKLHDFIVNQGKIDVSSATNRTERFRPLIC